MAYIKTLINGIKYNCYLINQIKRMIKQNMNKNYLSYVIDWLFTKYFIQRIRNQNIEHYNLYLRIL